MNDEFNVDGIELDKSQMATCAKLANTWADGQGVFALIELAMKLGMKYEQDAFE